MSRVLHVVGAPATGKTTVRLALARALELPSFAIDEERLRILAPGERWPENDAAAWVALRQAAERHDPCIIETSGRSERDAWLLAGHEVFRILCRASREARRRRLVARVRRRDPLAATAQYVTRLLGQGDPDLPARVVCWNDEPWSITPIAKQAQAWLAAAPAGV